MMRRSRVACSLSLFRRVTRGARVPVGLAALTLACGVTRIVQAFEVSKVTGTTSETEGSSTAETVASVSVRPSDGARIETIQSNDNNIAAHPGFITNSGTDRTVASGASNIGWDTRIRMPGSDGAWMHNTAPVPNNATYPFNVVWGDPALASNPDMPLYVFFGALSIPTAKFSAFAGSDGLLHGSFANTDGQTPIGGACVYRSIDGGVTFNVSDCFMNTTPDGVSEDTLGHFYDGGAMAIVHLPNSSTFSAFYTAIDVNNSVEATWTMPDVTGTATHPFEMDPTIVGTTGAQPGSVNDIDTHVQLRASPTGDLWKMSASNMNAGTEPMPSENFPTLVDGVAFTPAELKINVRNRNADAFGVADDAVIQLSLNISSDLVGQPASMRSAQDFDFDVGLNEQGREEMRFVYMAADANGSGFLYYLQGGSCTYTPGASPDLVCSHPAQWRTPMTSVPTAMFPAIRYGLSPATNVPTWMVTFQSLSTTSPQTFSVFAGNLMKDATATALAFNPVQVGPTQGSCPDIRGGAITVDSDNPGYWGDYDAMAYDSVTGNFIRPFTDSTQGCIARQPFNSNQVYISTVEVPGLLSCTTASGTPENTTFEIDTGFTPVGSTYGQATCPNQFLVDVDLTKSLNGQVSVAAQWSDAVTACTGLNATMTVFALPSGSNAAWQIFDQVTYQNSGTSCAASTIHHTNPADDGFEGATVTASDGFSELVVAVDATQTTGGSTQQIPVLVFAGP